MPGSKINLNLVQICNRGGYWIVGFSRASQSSQSKRVRACITSIIKAASEGVKSPHRAISSIVLLHPRQSSLSSSMRHVPTQGEGFSRKSGIVCVEPHVYPSTMRRTVMGGWGRVGSASPAISNRGGHDPISRSSRAVNSFSISDADLSAASACSIRSVNMPTVLPTNSNALMRDDALSAWSASS